jgi:hypothetical protein
MCQPAVNLQASNSTYGLEVLYSGVQGRGQSSPVFWISQRGNIISQLLTIYCNTYYQQPLFETKLKWLVVKKKKFEEIKGDFIT